VINTVTRALAYPPDLHRWRWPAAFQTGAPELDDLRAVLPEADLVRVRRCVRATSHHRQSTLALIADPVGTPWHTGPAGLVSWCGA
jgi:hypothetical protein